MAFEFTVEQKDAITSRGTSILVSAAAGSGKTRVLTERVMGYITDENAPADIDSFLIITYTRAAAIELRGRIMSEISSRCAENPLDRRMARQQNLCYRAMIGTIHSFCTSLLRENCHELSLMPAFSVLDTPRSDKLKALALEKTLEARYASMDARPDFRLLADTVGVGRDDKRLAETILGMHEKLLSHPYPEKWAEEQKRLMSCPTGDAFDTPWGAELLSGMESSAEFWVQRLESEIAEIAEAGGKTEKAYLQSFMTAAEGMREFLRALRLGWDRAREAAEEIEFPRLGAVREADRPECFGRVKAAWDGCKKAVEGFKSRLSTSSEQALGEVAETAPAMCELLELTLEFDRRYRAEKRRVDALDFSDLEHLALRLLIDPETGAPTETAKSVSSRFTEIMVDEYQDVNAVQELIFSAVSRGGKNLFMVGDVKQSIYRFRLADPTIFMEKYRRYQLPGSEGRLILLRENFRSRRCVLEASNHVFRTLMSERLGEMEYDELAELRFGAKGYPDGTDCPVELNVLDTAAGADDDSPISGMEEAEFVASSIERMLVSKAVVYENGAPRPCRPGDFAILLHSPGVSGARFAAALEKRGLPVRSGQGGGFFESQEIKLMLDLLTVVDEPRTDIQLISLLRSPLFAFTPDELAAIRASRPSGCFYDAVLASARGGDEKSAEFLSVLDELREIASELPLGGFLWHIYAKTDIFALCAAGREGENAHENLMLLVQCASDFLAGGETGLGRFIVWLNNRRERGEEPESAESGDCISIMSIHKSKGLEFPFVFLADLSHKFNRRDIYAPVLIHAGLGLGAKLTRPGSGVEYPTMARRAIAQRSDREKLSEELRVLYVAMTRAKERLFMSGVLKNAEESIEKLRDEIGSSAPAELMLPAQNALRWLLAAACLDKRGVIKLSVLEPEKSGGAGSCADDTTPAPDEAALRELEENLSFRYPYDYVENLPTKLTATGLREGEEPDADAVCLEAPAKREFRPPKLQGKGRESAAQRGTATHLVLERARLERLSTEEGVLEETARLCGEKILSPESAEQIDRQMLLNFGKSEICREMSAADELRREFRFTLLADAADYYDVPRGEKLMLQGVVDCFFVKNGEITVVDYKTDRVGESAREKAREYETQLRTYASALRRITGLPVRRAVVFFLRNGEAVEIGL